jgi:hypothetical protein
MAFNFGQGTGAKPAASFGGFGGATSTSTPGKIQIFID